MSPPRSISVSVIICTRNRCEALARTLASVKRLDISAASGFELVVVDNASADDTKGVVSGFAASAPFEVVYVLERGKGLSHARNRGLKESSGDLIMFTDDDCLVDSAWVRNAVHVFAGDAMKLVGGRIDLYNDAHLPITIKPSPTPDTLSSPGSLLGFVHGANLAFGRGVMERIGVFDVRLGAGTDLQSAEDTEYVYRAFKHGIPVLYEPGLKVFHDHGRTGLIEEYALLRGYAVGEGAMLAKHVLRGNFDLVKPLYWDVRAALRGWKADRTRWRWPLSKIGLAVGVARYLLRARLKSAE